MKTIKEANIKIFVILPFGYTNTPLKVKRTLRGATKYTAKYIDNLEIDSFPNDIENLSNKKSMTFDNNGDENAEKTKHKKEMITLIKTT